MPRMIFPSSVFIFDLSLPCWCDTGFTFSFCDSIRSSAVLAEDCQPPDILLNAYPKIQICLPPDPSDGSFASLPSVSTRIQYQKSFRRSVVLTPSPITFLHYRDILISQCRSLFDSFSCVTYGGGSKMKYNLLMPYFKRAVCNPNK